MNDLFKLKGSYRFEGYNIHGKKIEDFTIDNLLVQNFYTALWEFLNYTADTPSANAIDLTYMATGDDDTAVSISDTLLGNEVFRKALTSKSYSDSIFSCQLVLNPTESNFDIKEIGVFAGGSITPDSGLLISHANVDISKNINIQYIITYTISRG